MAASVEWFETIRGTEVLIKAASFDGDPSVGIPYGPEELSAESLEDGSEFELTDEETERLTVVASEIMEQRDYGPEW